MGEMKVVTAEQYTVTIVESTIKYLEELQHLKEKSKGKEHG